MMLQKSSNDEDISRMGEEYRVNPERYFYVVGQGWYVLAREGIGGPYPTKERARVFIRTITACLCVDQKSCLRVVTR